MSAIEIVANEDTRQSRLLALLNEGFLKFLKAVCEDVARLPNTGVDLRMTYWVTRDSKGICHVCAAGAMLYSRMGMRLTDSKYAPSLSEMCIYAGGKSFNKDAGIRNPHPWAILVELCMVADSAFRGLKLDQAYTEFKAAGGKVLPYERGMLATILTPALVLRHEELHDMVTADRVKRVLPLYKTWFANYQKAITTAISRREEMEQEDIKRQETS